MGLSGNSENWMTWADGLSYVPHLEKESFIAIVWGGDEDRLTLPASAQDYCSGYVCNSLLAIIVLSILHLGAFKPYTIAV